MTVTTLSIKLMYWLNNVGGNIYRQLLLTMALQDSSTISIPDVLILLLSFCLLPSVFSVLYPTASA